MKKINTENFEDMEEHNLYLDGKTKMVSMPTIPSNYYVNLLEEVDELLEEFGLEIVLINPHEFEMEEPGVAFRIEKK